MGNYKSLDGNDPSETQTNAAPRAGLYVQNAAVPTV